MNRKFIRYRWFVKFQNPHISSMGSNCIISFLDSRLSSMEIREGNPCSTLYTTFISSSSSFKYNALKRMKTSSLTSSNIVILSPFPNTIYFTLFYYYIRWLDHVYSQIYMVGPCIFLFF